MAVYKLIISPGTDIRPELEKLEAWLKRKGADSETVRRVLSDITPPAGLIHDKCRTFAGSGSSFQVNQLFEFGHYKIRLICRLAPRKPLLNLPRLIMRK